MAQSVRVEFPGAFYHVMARGNRREPIFLNGTVNSLCDWLISSIAQSEQQSEKEDVSRFAH